MDYTMTVNGRLQDAILSYHSILGSISPFDLIRRVKGIANNTLATLSTLDNKDTTGNHGQGHDARIVILKDPESNEIKVVP